MKIREQQLWLTRDGELIKIDTATEQESGYATTTYPFICHFQNRSGVPFVVTTAGTYFLDTEEHDNDLIQEVTQDKNPEYFL